MAAIRIAIIEDNATFAATIEGILQRPGSGIECGAVYPNAEEALSGIGRARPDLVLVDINLPGMSGIECIGKLKRLDPSLICLVLTTFDNNTMIFDSLKAGACGYLLKRTPPAEIVAAILQARAGGSPMSPHIARQVVSYFHRTPEPSERTSLDDPEREVIELLAQGLLYKEVAERLGITIDVVRRRVKKIYEKLHAHTRMEAVNKYRDRPAG
jgi:DNA-binding NarL/FixJ family response regulator